MISIKRIGVNMISGGAGYLFSVIINVISTPLLLNQLGEEAFGLQVIASVIIGYLIVADMGMDIPIVQRIAEFQAKPKPSEQSKFLFATLKIYVLIGVSGMVLLFAATEQLLTLLSIPTAIVSDARVVFYLSGIGYFGSIINMWGKAVFNGFHRYDISNGLNILNNLIGVSLGLMLVVADYGIIGFFAARVGTFLLTNIAFLTLTRRYIKQVAVWPFVDRDIWSSLRGQVGYGFMLRTSGMIFSRMDQSLISAWVGIAAVTIYSIPILVATTLSGLVSSIIQFTFPIFSAMKLTGSPEEIESFFIKASKISVIFSSMIFVPFIILGDKVLALWLNPQIASDSSTILPLLTIAFYINACLNMAVNSMIVAIGGLRYFTFYSIIRGVSLLVGFILLIKPYGIDGAGFSYICVLVIDMIFVLVTVRKVHISPVGLFFKVYLRPMLLAVTLGALLYLGRELVTDIGSLLVAVILFEALYVIVGYILNIADEDERQKVFSLINSINQTLFPRASK